MATPTYSSSIGSGTSASSANTHETGTFTPGGTNRLVLVYAQSSDGSPADISAGNVKIGSTAGAGGTALTRVTGSTIHTIGGVAKGSLWYTTTEPAASAQTIWAQWDAVQGERLLVAIALSDVDISGTPLGAVRQTTGTGSGNATISTIVAAVGDLIVDVVGFVDTGAIGYTLSPANSQTERIETATTPSAYDRAAFCTLAAAGTSETRGQTISSTPDGWGIFAIAVKGTATPPPVMLGTRPKRYGSIRPRAFAPGITR